MNTTIVDATAAIADALAAHKFETARRLSLAALVHAVGSERAAILRLLHQAYCKLGDMPQALAVTEGLAPVSEDECLEVWLLQAEDYHRLSAYDFYRGSVAERSGITGDEYAEQMLARSREAFERALALATTAPRKAALAALLRRCGQREQADALSPLVPGTPSAVADPATGTVTGILRDPDGRPVAGATITLGLQVTVIEPDPASYLKPDLGYRPKIGAQQALTTCTDDQGCFTIADVPAGRHEFLAATLDAPDAPLLTHFFAHGIEVAAGTTSEIQGTLTEWQSAQAPPIAHPFPETLLRDGHTYQLLRVETWRNPFYYDFPRQLVTLSVTADERPLLLLNVDDLSQPLAYQPLAEGIAFYAELPAMSERAYALYQAEESLALPTMAADMPSFVPEEDGHTAALSTGVADYRIPYGKGVDALPPIMAVRGADGVWRGKGRFVLPDGVTITSRRTEIVEAGPLLLAVQISYVLSTGDEYRLTLTADRNEPYLLVRECCPDLDGAAFEFSLCEFSGGRGFLHWTPEAGGRHWHTLSAEDAERARLQESVPWWIPPQGFGYAMTADGLAAQDYLAVFTVRRGEWDDRKFAELAKGPGENRELDWPFPEMVGSTISMITANTDTHGDAYYRFKFFDGERQWGLLVSTLADNDGPWKAISACQHKNSSPRLQEFITWQLDAPDMATHPWLMVRRDDVPAMRAKTDSPRFARYWEAIRNGKARGAEAGIRFLVDGDPHIAWRAKREMVGVAHIYSRMVLLGRDFADVYSPVGVRPIAEWAKEFDCLVASGVFTPDEELLVRRFLLLMAHMFLQPDLMNWHYGARNANFEADRVGAVGTVGLVFAGHPDAVAFVAHARERLAEMLEIYSTPGSGKWYENPACYYLTSVKCWGSLAYHLIREGYCTLADVPRLQDFLRWGMLLLTPRTPHEYDYMCIGSDDATYRAKERVRRIPPIGDHAHIGPWVPEQYLLLASLYAEADPAFADLLKWAYHEGGGYGGYFGDVPQAFASMTEADLTPADIDIPLHSRRLEGFGAVLRGQVGQEDEFYLLVKQGPGGYRYHRTEGSFLLFANGKPLIYDGGEAGETWRHSTLAFYDVHMPLAPGHVERVATLPSVEFVQGVHPVALKPGQPIFLNDSCHHELVPVAYARYNEPDPADVRSFTWVKDEYVIVHDDLHLDPSVPVHWHLQVVAESEAGCALDGYRFHGRYGTDLQVQLPGQQFVAESVETHRLLEYHMPPENAFAMRHLSLQAEAPSQLLAVLRPLSAGKLPITARLLTNGARAVGVQVDGDGLHDRVFLAREAVTYADAYFAFTGRYGGVFCRGAQTSLVLQAAGEIRLDSVGMRSDGPCAELAISDGQYTLTAHGTGSIELIGLGDLQPVIVSNSSITRTFRQA